MLCSAVKSCAVQLFQVYTVPGRSGSCCSQSGEQCSSAFTRTPSLCLVVVQIVYVV